MVAKKASGSKAVKLKLTKETIRDLSGRVKAGAVRGGVLPGTKTVKTQTIAPPTQFSCAAKGC